MANHVLASSGAGRLQGPLHTRPNNDNRTHHISSHCHCYGYSYYH